MATKRLFNNPFRPGAGQLPPYLAGRQNDKKEFVEQLKQSPILKNLIITGLRGVGKTVLLETLKPIAIQNGWFWAGTDLSESASVSENTFAVRVLTDLSGITSSFTIREEEKKNVGFTGSIERREYKLTYEALMYFYSITPGLVADKLKRVLEIVWETVKSNAKGIVLAYDEAQNLKDQAQEKHYPLSVLLEVVQYLQRKEIPYLLILTGLPTLFPNLVEARTYAERMFHILTLDKLNEDECRDAIVKPIQRENCPVSFSEPAIKEIIKCSGGYPYFIQFFCKEGYDSYLQQLASGIEKPNVSIRDVIRKLDVDFYSGRWSRITDKQKELLMVIAKLPSANDEFTLQEIAAKSKELEKSYFSSSNMNQMLDKLINAGLIYKNRHGKYSFAVPLLAEYINRQEKEDSEPPF